MTALHPGLRQRSRVSVLDDSALREFTLLADSDPVVNAVVSARVRAAGSLVAARLGGRMIGVRRDDELVGACYAGGSLVPVGGDPESWHALAGYAARRPRGCTSIVGAADAVAVMWPLLARSWAPARNVRPNQPLLVLDGPVATRGDEGARPARIATRGDEGGRPARIATRGDEVVRPARPEELERYLPAATAMYTEELGVSPHVAPGRSTYRARVSELIGARRAFASFDFRGQVTFKAEIGAVSPHTCQIQGVWVRPDLRGRGIGTAALATVLTYALELAPTVSLYVNDYNTPARRMYARLGMRQVATLATILL